MAFPLVSEICTQIRVELADQDVSGGDIYTDTKLIPHIASAASDLWACSANIGGPRVLRTRYMVLRANQSVIDVAGTIDAASAILADIVDPADIAIRSGITEHTIANMSQSSTGMTITTSSAHGLATGDEVTITNLTKATSVPIGGDGMYGIEVTGATTFIALGGYARLLGAGTYDTTADTGRAISSSAKFKRLERARDMTLVPNHGYFAWEEERLVFAPIDEIRQVRVVYFSSATVPDETTDIIPWPDSKHFLAVLAAAYATTVRAPVISQTLMGRALGPTLQRDGSGGLLRDLVNQHIKAMQRMPASERQQAPYRDASYQIRAPLYG